MAVHFTFLHVMERKSIPYVSDSISLIELKDAIRDAIGLQSNATLKKKHLEQVDFTIFDYDTKEKIVDERTRIRKDASVWVKKIRAYLVYAKEIQQFARVSSSNLKVSSTCAKNINDDGFGEDIYF